MPTTTVQSFTTWRKSIRLSEQLFHLTGSFTNRALAHQLEKTALELTRALAHSCSDAPELDLPLALATAQSQQVSLQIELELATGHKQLSMESLRRFLNQLEQLNFEIRAQISTLKRLPSATTLAGFSDNGNDDNNDGGAGQQPYRTRHWPFSRQKGLSIPAPPKKRLDPEERVRYNHNHFAK